MDWIYCKVILRTVGNEVIGSVLLTLRVRKRPHAEREEYTPNHLIAHRAGYILYAGGKGRLTLDAGLLKLPRELGEYVIVHELVHCLAPNH